MRLSSSFPPLLVCLSSLSLTTALPHPGMLAWVCKSCPNPNMLFTAGAEMVSPSGQPVGQLKLEQSISRDVESTEVFSVQIDTADNRVNLANLKTSYFQVQIRSGSCDNLGDVKVSQYCRGCTNSLGVAVAAKDGEPLALADLIGDSVVFFDSKNTNTKLACGEIENGQMIEDA